MSPNISTNKALGSYANSPVRINHDKININPGNTFVKNLKIKHGNHNQINNMNTTKPFMANQNH